MAKSDKDAGQAVHHHYYYGASAPGMGAAPGQAGAQQGSGGWTPPGAQQGPNGWTPPGAAAGSGAGSFNQHPHPRADSLVKGLIVGAGVAYLATNETVQRNVLRTVFQLWSAMQGGVAEFKERMQDAEAEVETEREDAPAAEDPSPAPASTRRPRASGPRPVGG